MNIKNFFHPIFSSVHLFKRSGIFALGLATLLIMSVVTAAESAPFCQPVSDINCETPTQVQFSELTESSVRVTWQIGDNETTWRIVYCPAGAAPSGYVPTTLNTNSFVITGLTASTAYDVYVQAVCNESDYSEWTTAATFTTRCALYSIPFYENFDSYPAAPRIGVGELPPCWDIITTGTRPEYYPHIFNQAGGWNISGNGLALFSANDAGVGTTNYAALPRFRNNLNSVRISFKAKESGNAGILTLGYFTNIEDINSFIVLDTVPLTTVAATYSYPLNGREIPQGAQLAFRQQGGYSSSFCANTAVDSIVIEFLPCAPVSQVEVSDVMMTTAHVEWTAGAWESTWSVEYGAAGFTPGTGTTLLVDTNACDLTNLIGQQTYDLYVRAACDLDNMSAYSEVVSFYTYCESRSDTTLIVQCDSFTWHGKTYYQSGLYFDTIARVADQFCDSIYSLQLTIQPSYYIFDTLILCQNDLPFTKYDTTFDIGSSDSTYTFYYQSEHGCDSTIQVQLYILPSFHYDLYDTICANELPYAWADTLFQEGTLSGEYIFHYMSEQSCDSMITLHLLVHEKFEQFELVEICEHEFPYTWRDTTFEIGTTNQLFTFYRQTQYGCDSIVKVAVIVHSSTLFEHEDTICADMLPYTWRDTTFEVGTTTGYYYFAGTAANRCENHRLHLVVGGYTQDIFHPDTLRICRNELPYTWQGNLDTVIFDTDINRGLRRVVTTGGGCIDTNYLFIDLLDSRSYEISETICSSQLPYTLQDTTFDIGTVSGSYQIRRPARNGCFDITTINLTVNPTYILYDTLTICQSQLPYRWNNEWLQVGMTTGTYTYSRTAHNGCDSTTHLSLTVNPSYNETVTLSVCEDELPVLWRGHLIERGIASQTITYTETTLTGCDSVVTLKLLVQPRYRQNETLSICATDLPYSWRDTTFEVGTLSGVYLFERASAAGCDSTVLLRLTVLPATEESITLDICRADLPYSWRDTIFTENTQSGTYDITSRNEAGCRQVVHLQLHVHESIITNKSLTICENDLPYEWHGHVIPRGTHTGDIFYRSQSQFGCDSITLLKLVVNPAFHETEQITICENDLPYAWRDTVFEQGSRGGTFLFEKTTRKGCDSIVVLYLTIHPAYSIEKNLTICQSELPYAYEDTTFGTATQSGTYYLHRTTANGCDSTLILNLTIHPTYAITQEIHLCQSQLPYIFGDTIFGTDATSGTHTLYRHTTRGCDSIITIKLTVYQELANTKSYEICSSELPYSTEDTIFPVGTTTGTYSVIYPSTHGCDSIIAIQLTVNPTYHVNNTIQICQDELPYTWRDTTFQAGTVSNIYTFHRQSLNHCDSIVHLALIVQPSYQLEEEAAVCANGFPFTWRDTTFQAGTTNGDFVFYRQTAFGCDSIVTLHLSVFPTYQQTEQLSICQSDLPYTWRDTTFQANTPSGFYHFSRESIHGCDSMVTLALTVLPSSSQAYNLRLCSSQLPYHWAITDTLFDLNTESGTYTFNYRNSAGCDSTIVLYLNVLPSYRIMDTLAICHSDLPYLYEPANHTFGANVVSGDYTFTLSTAAGCDSIFQLHLTINQSYNEQITEAICADAFPFTWRDTTFTDSLSSGSYNFTFHRTSTAGCDSIVRLTLRVNPLPNISITTIPNGDYLMLLAVGSSNCTYTWSTGEESNAISVPASSTENYSVTATHNTTGCSNAAYLYPVSIPDNVVSNHQVSVFPNPTDGNVTVKSDELPIREMALFDMTGKMVKRLTVGSTETTLNLTYLTPGSYLLHLTLQNGEIVRNKLIIR